MEKKIKLLLRAIGKKNNCKANRINIDIEEYNNKFTIYYHYKLAVANNLDLFIKRLIVFEYINPEDLIPKKREKKELVINKGKI